MRSILKEQQRSSVITAVVTALLGLVLLVWPEWAMKWTCILLGVVLAITGATYVIGFFQGRKAGFALYYSLPLGIVLLALGVWLLTNPSGIIRLVQYACGGFILLHGVMDLQGAISIMHDSNGPERWVALALSVLTLVLGLVIIFNPLGTMATLLMFIGIVLIFDGLSDLWLIYRLTKLAESAFVDGKSRDL